MKAFLIFLAMLIIPASSIASTPRAALLTPQNTLTLFGEVNEDMVENVARRIPDLASQTVYVQILSPGGSVLSGKRVIDQLLGLQLQGKKVVCVAHVAISMAFVILQSPACPVRQVVSGAVLMQHQATIGVEGPVRNLLSNVTAILQELEELEKMQALRMGMNLSDFRTAITHDFWMHSGFAALRAKAADSQAVVICSPAIIKAGRTQEIVFGRIKLVATFSDCPYVVKPKIEMVPVTEDKRRIKLELKP